jgi:hypothetical protein
MGLNHPITMAWSAKLVSVEKQQGKAHIVINYSDGTSSFNEDQWLSSPQTLNDIVATRIAQLSSVDTFVAGIVLGPLSSTPTPPSIQTAPQIAQNKFLVDYNRWLSVKRAIDAGILTGTEPEVQALKSLVQTEYSAAYINVI